MTSLYSDDLNHLNVIPQVKQPLFYPKIIPISIPSPDLTTSNYIRWHSPVLCHHRTRQPPFLSDYIPQPYAFTPIRRLQFIPTNPNWFNLILTVKNASRIPYTMVSRRNFLPFTSLDSPWSYQIIVSGGYFPPIKSVKSVINS